MIGRRTVVHGGRRYRIDRGVFDPARHLSGVAFADELASFVAAGDRVLDVGTGCGLLAGTAADLGATVVATDLDGRAVRCARANLAGTGVDVRQGDLFAAVAGERFDVVVCNPPYEIRRARRPTLASPDAVPRLLRTWADHGDRLVLGWPDDDRDTLAALGVTEAPARVVPTAGRALALFELRA